MEGNGFSYNYRAFGLEISSTFPLESLMRVENREPDVVITLSDELPDELPDSMFEHWYSIEDANARLFFSEVGEFHVRNGREIIIRPEKNVDWRLICLPLFGAVFAVLLHQRGNLVLHASSVEIDGKAIILAGQKGDGKSTLAASLGKSGFSILNDDVTPVRFAGAGLLVYPGFPFLKLNPDAIIQTVGSDLESYKRIAKGFEKRVVPLGNDQSDVCPLGAVFVLEDDPAVGITRLSFQESVQCIVSHSYIARFTDDWIARGLAAHNFLQSTSLIASTPVFRFSRPRDLNAVSKLAKTISSFVKAEL